jgi:hypothetical protein
MGVGGLPSRKRTRDSHKSAAAFSPRPFPGSLRPTQQWDAIKASTKRLVSGTKRFVSSFSVRRREATLTAGANSL